MSWNRAFKEMKAFFASGVFYIVAGSGFLYVAYSISLANRAHSAFVFLLAILGVALVLYGTGTHAAGSGSTGNMKVVIAGGAGVLALVLGMGVLQFNESIGTVFKRTLDYGLLKLEIDPTSSTAITADLSAFEVHARAGARPLHLWNDNQTVEILVPINSIGKSDVLVSLTAKPGLKEIQSRVNEEYELSWDDEQVEKQAGFNNEIVSAITRSLDLSTSGGLSVTPVSEGGGDGDPFAINPQ